MNTLSLQSLLKPWLNLKEAYHCPITGLSLDSRTVKKGNIFFALTQDPKHIQEAIQKGAAAILCEQPFSESYSLPVLTIKDLSKKIGPIAAYYFGNPSQKMRVIGVTGTNGKTSCTHFIAQALKLAGHQSAVIGTLGNGLINQITESTHTTPDAIALQTLLSQLQKQKADTVAIETSSHGLQQHRTAGTTFFLGIFTNLTRDHLDYHGTMTNYAKAKFQLFQSSGCRYGILNADDTYGKKWLLALKDHLTVYATSLNPKLTLPSNIPVIHATNIRTKISGLMANLSTPWGEGILHTSLLGQFNLSNLLSVVGTLGILGIPLATTLDIMRDLKNVPGRMQKIEAPSKPKVIIDYAHTPDALKKALSALREHCKGKIWCVFGCGGNRDRGKRPKMGHIANILADYVILTDDNPRQEDPLQIIKEIYSGISHNNAIIIEHQRQQAIAYAIQQAEPEDIILIAGKGHETYQIIGEKKCDFDDFVVAQNELAKRKS